MKLDNLNKWLTLVANLGVLAGIIFLGAEIQQSNRIAVATTEIGIRNSFDDVNSAVYSDGVLAGILEKAELEGEEFDPIEDRRYSAWIIQLVNVWLSIEIAYENGMAPEETYNVIFDDISATLRSPGSRQFLRNIYDGYPSLHGTDVFVFLDEQLTSRGI